MIRFRTMWAILLATVCSTAGAQAPSAEESQGQAPLKFVERSEWTDFQPSFPSVYEQGKIRMVTLHQTEARNQENASLADEFARLRGHLKFHTTAPDAQPSGKGWPDIAYHYIVGPSGNVYRCRDPKFQGDSATINRANLTGNIAVCLMGDFRSRDEKMAAIREGIEDGSIKPGTQPTPDQFPTAEALRSVVSIVADELKKHELTAAEVRAHRELAGSDCPGGLFYPMIKTVLIPAIESLLNPTQ